MFIILNENFENNCFFKENTLAMYEKGLNLIVEGEKMKNARKSEMWKMLQESKSSVQHR